ncbi:MAG: tetratricopeptide repeat protein [Planctomycetota bacterium]|nr:tetratricopeptide repeat protein [Planctomycetota bacterium]
MQRDQRQGQILIERGLLPQETVRSAFEMPRSSSEDLCWVLVNNGYLANELAQQIRGEVQQQLDQLNRGLQHSIASQSHFSIEAPNVVNALTALRQKALSAYQQVFRSDPRFSPHADVVFIQGQQLGVGGMGVVYQVEDKRLDRQAALKLLKADEKDPNGVRRFWREARITARLDHPAIPPVYESGTTTSGENYLLMRLIAGGTLDDQIKEYHREGRPQKGLRKLIEVLIKVAEAVAYAHSRRVIHRDLKPANIMVGQFGEVMVMDWGLARDLTEDEDSRWLDTKKAVLSPEVVGSGLTQSGEILGTPGYMSPEQARSEEIDERTDVFSIGCILAEVLTGKPPIEGATAIARVKATMSGHVVLPASRISRIDPELQSITADSLEFNRDDRIESAAMVAFDLRAYLSGDEVLSHDYSAGERLRRWLRSHSVVVVVVTLALVFVLLAGLFFLQIESAKANQALAEKAEQRMTETMTNLSKAEALVRRRARPELILQCTEPALKAGGRKEWLLLNVAKIYRDAKLPDRARVLLEESVSHYPPGFEALHFLHQIELEHGTNISQMRAYKRFLAVAENLNDERNEYFLRALALKAKQRGDEAEALKQYARIESELGVLRGSDFNERGKCLVALKRAKEGYGAYSRAVELNGNKHEFWTNRAKVLHSMRKYREALSDVNRSVSLNGHIIETLIVRSQVLQKLKNLDAALKDIQRVIGLNPRYAKGYCERGIIRSNMGQYAGALEDLNKAISLAPDESLFYYSRANIHCQSGRFDLGLKDFDLALKKNPDFPDCLKNRGRLHRQNNHLGKALADYNQALNLVPDRVEILRLRCNLLIYMRRYDDALVDANRVIELNYRTSGSYFNRGAIYSSIGRHKEAIQDDTEAIKRSVPGELNDDIYFNRGMSYRALKQYQMAVQDFTAALNIKPGYAQACYQRGMTYRDMGKYQLAIFDLRKTLNLAPNNPQASAIRKMINDCERQRRGQ